MFTKFENSAFKSELDKTIQNHLEKAFKSHPKNLKTRNISKTSIQNFVKHYGVLETLMSQKIPTKVAISNKNISKLYMSQILGEKNCLRLVGRNNLFEQKKKFVRKLGILNESEIFKCPSVYKTKSISEASNKKENFKYPCYKRVSELKRQSIQIVKSTKELRLI